MGLDAYREVLKKSKLSTDPVATEQVRRVGRWIAEATGRTDYQWEFSLIEDKQVNAFCLPGGKVAVYTGLLQVAQNDDQLATVLSHEIAHALAHHTSERIARGGLEHGNGGIWAKSFDRREESEADRVFVGAR